MAFFFLEYLFFVTEIFTFLCYANKGSDDVIGGSSKTVHYSIIIGGSSKTVQHSITNISRNINAVFLKLGTRNEHHKRKKMSPVVLLP